MILGELQGDETPPAKSPTSIGVSARASSAVPTRSKSFSQDEDDEDRYEYA